MPRLTATLLTSLATAMVNLLPGTFPSARAGSPSPCAAVARVTGESELVAKVLSLLQERGVKVNGTSQCGTVLASLIEGESTAIVIVIAQDGRRIERPFTDPYGAATVIESWTRDDLAAPLMLARHEPPSAPMSRPAVAPAVAVTAMPDQPGRRMQVGVGPETTVSGDGALWTGAAAQGCVQIGRLCTGVRARYAVDTERSGDSRLWSTQRTAIDLLLGVDAPMRRRRLLLVPGLALGQSSVAIRRQTPGIRDSENLSSLLLRASVAVGISVSRDFSLNLSLAAGLAPFARTRVGGGVDADNEVDGDPPLAGMPKFSAMLALGLTYEGL